MEKQILDLLIEMNQEMKNMNPDIQSLKTGMETANSDIQSLKTGMETANLDIQSLKMGMETANSDIQFLKSEMKTANSDMQSLKTGMKTANSDIQSLKSEMNNRFDMFDAKMDNVGIKFEETNESRINERDFIIDKVNKMEKELYILKNRNNN